MSLIVLVTLQLDQLGELAYFSDQVDVWSYEYVKYLPLKLRNEAIIRRFETTMAMPIQAMAAACVSDSSEASGLSATETSPPVTELPREPIILAGILAGKHNFFYRQQ